MTKKNEKQHEELTVCLTFYNELNDGNSKKEFSESTAKLRPEISIVDIINNANAKNSSTTILAEQSHIIKSLKEDNQSIKVDITFQSEFNDILQHFNTKLKHAETNNEDDIKEFVSHISLADKITFASEESKDQYLSLAENSNISIDASKIELDTSLLPLHKQIKYLSLLSPKPLERRQSSGSSLNSTTANAQERAKRTERRKRITNSSLAGMRL